MATKPTNDGASPPSKRVIAYGAVLALAVLLAILLWPGDDAAPSPKPEVASAAPSLPPPPPIASTAGSVATSVSAVAGGELTPRQKKDLEYAQLELQRIEAEEARLAKIDFDAPRPPAPAPSAEILSKGELSLSATEKAQQTEAMIGVLKARVQAMETKPDVKDQTLHAAILKRLKERVVELEDRKKQLIEEAKIDAGPPDVGVTVDPNPSAQPNGLPPRPVIGAGGVGPGK